MANSSDEILLDGVFSMSASNYNVILTSSSLLYTRFASPKSIKVLQISDIVGCHSRQTNSTTLPVRRDNAATITIFAYPFQKFLLNGKRTRRRVILTFEIRCCSSEEENNRTALKWKNTISCLARGFQVELSDVGRCEPPPWGRFLILINPKGGTGKAMKLFRTTVAPMLEEAGIPYEDFVTEYPGHAMQLMQKLDLTQWAAVILLSGDGLIYEVINGLMQRVDWSSAIRKPIGVVPAGSGNALACSISHAAGIPVMLNPVLHSTFMVIKHRVVPMDLVLVQTPSKQFFSFLSLTWGLIADVDLESEKYRYLGEARFTLGGLKSVVNRQAYAGKLSFLPVAEYPSTKNKGTSETEHNGRRSSPCSTSTVSNQSQTSATEDQLGSSVIPCAESAEVGSQSEHADSGGGRGGGFHSNREESRDRPEVHSSEMSVQNGPCHITNDSDKCEMKSRQCADVYTAVKRTPESATPQSGSDVSGNDATATGDPARQNDIKPSMNTVEHNEAETRNVDGGGELRPDSHVLCSLLPPLDQPVGEDWVVITGRFIMVCALYQTHIGSDLFMAPSSRLSDGVIHLLIVREGITRQRLLRLLLSFSEGTHVDSPDVEIVPVRAFRLEPGKDSRHVMVDGERLDPEPLQAQVLTGVARVLAS